MSREVAVLFELRCAVRQLLKSPWFSIVAIVGLGLGIGANVALFSVIHSVLLRPLPYRDPGRLVRLSSTNTSQNLTRAGFSYPRYLEVQQRQQVFSDLALSAGNAFTLTGRGDAEQLPAIHASASLLPTLGLEPVLVRNFSADENTPGGPPVVLISHDLWRQDADDGVGSPFSVSACPGAVQWRSVGARSLCCLLTSLMLPIHRGREGTSGHATSRQRPPPWSHRPVQHGRPDRHVG